MLDIVVSFNKNNLKYTFSLPVRIAEDSKVDLILGLETIKKLNLVKIIPEFFQYPENIKNEKIQSLQKLNHSTNLVFNHVDVPLMLEAESDTVTSITDSSLPPVITSLEGIKPSDAASRWQDNMVARGACTSKTCTTSCGCPTSLAAAAARLDSDGSFCTLRSRQQFCCHLPDKMI